jgi:GAF domain-containing protein
MDDAGSLMRRTPDLAATAQLCADLARVEETRELPGLLARAASVLEASGIIIWMAEGARSELRPVLAHGYSPQALGKMGTLPRDSETATAAAYRAGQLRTVASDTFSNGAIVVPLVTSAGCIGVMAAEVRNGAEAEPAERALATIVAAQLATLITPAPTENAVQAQG